MVRGMVMRDTNAGAGVVMVGTAQKPFTLEMHWKSSVPPVVGGVVDVVLDPQDNILEVRAVEESTLAKEQAQKALSEVKSKGMAFTGLVTSKVGLPTLVAIAGLLAAWFFLPVVSIQLSQTLKNSFTFWDLLGLNFSGGGLRGLNAKQGAGFTGFIAILCALAPIAPHFHPHKLLNLAYCAPLGFMVLTVMSLYLGIRSEVQASIEQARQASALFGGAASRMTEAMIAEMSAATWKAVSIGAGVYVGIAIAGYLAFVGVRRYLVSRAMG